MADDAKRQITRRIRVSSTVVGFVAALLSVVLVLVAVRASMSVRQSEHLESRLLYITNILTSVDESLIRLNALNLADCTVTPEGAYDNNFASMHRELFFNEFITDVGFYRHDWLACTTGRGVLNTPMRDKPADAETRRGRQFWFNQLLYLFVINGRYEGAENTVIRSGDYHVAVNFEDLQQQLAWSGDWRLLVRYDGNEQVLSGAARLDGAQYRWQPTATGDVADSQCVGQDVQFCLQLRSSLRDWLLGNPILLFLLIPICIGVGLIAGFYCARELSHRYSSRGRIMRGLKSDSFHIVFQPIVDLRDGRNVGCEATARFRDQFGEIPREEFGPLIRKMGKTWEFTRRMVEIGMAELARYDDWPPRFRVSMNMFAEDIASGAALELREMESIDHDKFRFILEIREDTLLDEDASIDTLTLLQEAGFWAALDHFGIGYSNLQTLENTRIKLLKIDPSFIKNIEIRNLRASLIPGIVSLAHGQRIAVVADGVENLRQVDVLLETNVVWGQGDALGKADTVDVLYRQTKQSFEHPIEQAVSALPGSA